MKLGLALERFGFQGGLERHAHDLARALVARGHEVRLLHRGVSGRDPDSFAAAFSGSARLGEPGALRGLDAVWVQKAASVEALSVFGPLPLVLAVHDHDLTCARTSRLRPPLRRACHRAPGLACLVTCAIDRERRPGGFSLRVVNALSLSERLRALARRAPLVACSAYLASTLVAAGVPERRVQVIHPVPPEPSAPLRPRPRERRLLVAAQLVRGKGVDVAIRALRHLSREVTLDVVGDGPARARLERLAAPLGSRVRFRGYVPPASMPSLYDECRTALVPSRWPEPFGLSGVEAMRRARPALGAAHGGILEWLAPDAGFTPDDERALARAADRSLEDERAGERALQLVRARFLPEALVQSVESALASACGRPDSSRALHPSRGAAP